MGLNPLPISFSKFHQAMKREGHIPPKYLYRIASQKSMLNILSTLNMQRKEKRQYEPQDSFGEVVIEVIQSIEVGREGECRRRCYQAISTKDKLILATLARDSLDGAPSQ
jgi:hypothetical protein